MPLFEYCCAKCGTVFEELIFGRAAQEPPCPKCGSAQTGRLVSRPSRHCGSNENAGSAQGSYSGASGCSGCSGGHCGSCGH